MKTTASRLPGLRAARLAAWICLGASLSAGAQDTARVVQVRVGAGSEAPGYEAWRGLDGDPATFWHTAFGDSNPTPPHDLRLDLGGTFPVEGFAYLPRPGAGNGTVAEYELLVGGAPGVEAVPVRRGTLAPSPGWTTVRLDAPVPARVVILRAHKEISGRPWASAAEVRILSPGVEFRADRRGAPEAAPATETERQRRTLLHDLGRREHFRRVAAETFRRDALILDGDRDPADVVLRRTTALLQDLRARGAGGPAPATEEELGALLARGRDAPVADAAARTRLHEDACRLRRRIAFTNPLLDFDEILFLKRHRAGYEHMCDQYYGTTARPGGGLFALSGAFRDEPRARDLLAGVPVRRGRLAGRPLEGGSFLSPDLSFDGKTVAFAYVECRGDLAHDVHTDPSRGHWDTGRSYHVFTAALDGGGIDQLTDGTWNDFDPCWMPDGRIAFVSERRGGYLRCGRVCPTFTLHDMDASGGDIRGLTQHETNEWHPSVTHDGRIIYTRWDYVDRHGCTAHGPWITTPDGRDPRAVHGNFAPRAQRPDMELDVRAVPGSHRFLATAAPHHGQAFGSLILVDPAVPDDDAMAPVRRLTPEIGFPETQRGSETYGSAWPLSEDYSLCVYDAAMEVPGLGPRGNYGIYLVDSFGNRELLYRDPGIACHNPIPLRPRPSPPALPPGSVRVPEGQPAEATVMVVDANDGLRGVPGGTPVKALRVYHALPMTVPSGKPPHETGMRIAGAGDSVTLARAVLGTVPVEPDGSAHFTVPARKELFFQALDAEGQAIQSMRSATIFQPGERATCTGCHDRRTAAPAPLRGVPAAFSRAPSRIAPDVEGSNPFSYPLLVQPVLDRHCVSCHAAAPGKAPRLDSTVVGTGARRWFASYESLAPKYAFWDYKDPYRTTAGAFGARAAPLGALLRKGHHGVSLPPEDLHRVTLWLDSASLFYGVYEKEGGEAQLRGEKVKPTLE